MSPQTLSEYIEGLPNISGSEDLVAQAMARSGPFYLRPFCVAPMAQVDARAAREGHGSGRLWRRCAGFLPRNAFAKLRPGQTPSRRIVLELVALAPPHGRGRALA
jgi:hypothetical protein